MKASQPAALSEDGVFSAALAHYAQGLLLETDEGRGSAAALASFQHAHRLDPLSAAPLAVTTLGLVEAGRAGEAVALLKAHTRRQPEHREGWVTLGHVAEAAKEPRCAARAFARARALLTGADDPDLTLAEIRNRFKAAEDRHALRLLRRLAAATNTPPAAAQAPLLWARHFILEDKTPARALPVIRLMVETAPTPAGKAAAQTFYGDATLRTGATNQALRAYWQALASVETHLPAAQRIASVLQQRADTNAVTRLGARIATARQPLAPALVTFFAWSLLDREETAAEALLAGRDAARTAGTQPPEAYYLMLGSSLDELERDARAAEVFIEGLTVHTDAHSLMNHLAYMWAVNNERLDEALAWAERALTHEPRNHAYVDTLGWVYYRLGRLHDALTQLLLAARLSPREDGVIFDHIGDVLYDLGRTEEALSFWRRALTLAPEIAGLQEKITARSPARQDASPFH